MNFSKLKYVPGSVGIVILMISLLQACHENYRMANISTTLHRTIDKSETPVNAGVLLSLQEYVLQRISYPTAAIINRVEGTVYIQFAIDDNGNVTSVAAIGTRIGYGLEEEAIRVVSAMPASISLALKGKKILPVVYRFKTSATALLPPMI